MANFFGGALPPARAGVPNPGGRACGRGQLAMGGVPGGTEGAGRLITECCGVGWKGMESGNGMLQGCNIM